MCNPQENSDKEKAFDLVYHKQLPKMSKITKRKYVEQEVMEYVVPTGNQQIVKVRWWPLLMSWCYGVCRAHRKSADFEVDGDDHWWCPDVAEFVVPQQEIYQQIVKVRWWPLLMSWRYGVCCAPTGTLSADCQGKVTADVDHMVFWSYGVCFVQKGNQQNQW